MALTLSNVSVNKLKEQYENEMKQKAIDILNIHNSYFEDGMDGHIKIKNLSNNTDNDVYINNANNIIISYSNRPNTPYYISSLSFQVCVGDDDEEITCNMIKIDINFENTRDPKLYKSVYFLTINYNYSHNKQYDKFNIIYKEANTNRHNDIFYETFIMNNTNYMRIYYKDPTLAPFNGQTNFYDIVFKDLDGVYCVWDMNNNIYIRNYIIPPILMNQYINSNIIGNYTVPNQLGNTITSYIIDGHDIKEIFIVDVAKNFINYRSTENDDFGDYELEYYVSYDANNYPTVGFIYNNLYGAIDFSYEILFKNNKELQMNTLEPNVKLVKLDYSLSNIYPYIDNNNTYLSSLYFTGHLLNKMGGLLNRGNSILNDELNNMYLNNDIELNTLNSITNFKNNIDTNKGISGGDNNINFTYVYNKILFENNPLFTFNNTKQYYVLKNNIYHNLYDKTSYTYTQFIENDVVKYYYEINDTGNEKQISELLNNKYTMDKLSTLQMKSLYYRNNVNKSYLNIDADDPIYSTNRVSLAGNLFAVIIEDESTKINPLESFTMGDNILLEPIIIHYKCTNGPENGSYITSSYINKTWMIYHHYNRRIVNKNIFDMRNYVPNIVIYRTYDITDSNNEKYFKLLDPKDYHNYDIDYYRNREYELIYSKEKCVYDNNNFNVDNIKSALDENKIVISNNKELRNINTFYNKITNTDTDNINYDTILYNHTSSYIINKINNMDISKLQLSFSDVEIK